MAEGFARGGFPFTVIVSGSREIFGYLGSRVTGLSTGAPLGQDGNQATSSTAMSSRMDRTICSILVQCID